MYCTKCGQQIPDDSQFCSFCGAKVSKKIEKVEISRDIKNESQVSNDVENINEQKDVGVTNQNNIGFLSNYSSFKGRIGRLEYAFRLFLVFVFWTMNSSLVMVSYVSIRNAIASFLIFLIFYFLYTSITKRCRDIGLPIYVPVLLFVVDLILGPTTQRFLGYRLPILISAFLPWIIWSILAFIPTDSFRKTR